MTRNDFNSLTMEEKSSYILHLVNKYKLTQKETCDVLGINPDNWDKFNNKILGGISPKWSKVKKRRKTKYIDRENVLRKNAICWYCKNTSSYDCTWFNCYKHKLPNGCVVSKRLTKQDGREIKTLYMILSCPNFIKDKEVKKYD